MDFKFYKVIWFCLALLFQVLGWITLANKDLYSYEDCSYSMQQTAFCIDPTHYMSASQCPGLTEQDCSYAQQIINCLKIVLIYNLCLQGISILVLLYQLHDNKQILLIKILLRFWTISSSVNGVIILNGGIKATTLQRGKIQINFQILIIYFFLCVVCMFMVALSLLLYRKIAWLKKKQNESDIQGNPPQESFQETSKVEQLQSPDYDSKFTFAGDQTTQYRTISNKKI
ncbi:hypothetical protein pb186bvf_003647 [Paramecium bursaria]